MVVVVLPDSAERYVTTSLFARNPASGSSIDAPEADDVA
jgi:hypothetical protein